ncbi:hypothetical protein SO802_016968 [Lithocarpus litseifolius]|uniref:Poly(A) RNA polymerase mitochondrial-like central palm domain-containing protein n=1 Tax=Lithocarpus litseifolius TaxID=425828 RepID=A0AAW2CXZ3_9ROSI
MSANSTLEHILEEILEVLKPKQEDLATRAQVINELRRVVESVPSLRGAAVEPFGSFVSNLFTKWGDVDISINLTKGGYISHVEYDHKIELLRDLKKSLTGQWQMVRLIPATVPILKCESSDNIFSCDISIDNLISQIKSKLLLKISEIDGRFRDMVLLVKEWAKAHEINDATSMSGTFNSYSLTLLVMFHFQTCEPAIFPPLKDIYAGNVADDLQGIIDVATLLIMRIEETDRATLIFLISLKFAPSILFGFSPFKWCKRCSGDTGTSSVLVGGLLLGGLAAGTLGYMYAPELSKAAGDLRRKFFDDSYDDSDKWCANSTLEPILEEILEVLKPKQEDLATRDQVINELRRVVESVQSLRGAAVEPFGSFVSNLFTKWGDVDISINLPKEGGYISYVESDRKQRLLVDLQNPLRGQWQMVQLIPAKVPILKCESSHKIFSCDISIDNLKGQMKSKLFLWISEIDGRFRDMILLVKEWAKTHEINDPNSGTINSYSLSLLVIFHFQTCEPAIFPPLKDIYAGNVADDLQGLRTVAERKIAEACAAKIRRFRQDKFRRFNQSSLSELFISFLAKFSDIGFKAAEQGICTYTGKWECRRSNIRWLRKTNAILIEDPFEQPENSARAVSMSGLTRISKAFEISCRRLSSAEQNQDSLLVTLVRSQVSQEIRAGPRNPVSYGGGYQPHLTHPHVHRNVNLQAETQNKFQNLRLKSNSNNPTLTETVNMYGKFEASESKTQNQFQNSRLESRSFNPSMTEIVQAQSQGQHSGDAGKSSLSVGGLLLGGLVAGLGYMYAPQISKAAEGLKKFLDNSDDDSDASHSRAWARLDLNQKTEKHLQLNPAINDVSAQLCGDDAPNGAAVNSDKSCSFNVAEYFVEIAI